MGLFNNRENMWIGTRDEQTGASRMFWVETPNTGADVSHQGQSAEATLLNGGGYARESWDSHKRFQFSWGESASPRLASQIQGLRNGSYGRGLIYFVDPMQYGLNVLPSRWADPSMAINYEAPSIAPNVDTTGIAATLTALLLPARAAQLNLPANYNSVNIDGGILVPVPPGHQVTFGWNGGRTNANSGIRIATSGITGITNGLVDPLPSNGAALTNVVGTAGSAGGFVRLYVITDASTSLLTINGMTMRIFEPGMAVDTSGPWTSGEGHSGCRFVGSPTLVNYNGVDGGRMGLSCTLKEVGSWE